jgi:hypothetical protein
MNPLNIKRTKKTPAITVDPQSGEFSLKGISLPENAREFFAPLINAVEDYMSEPQKETQLTIELDYYNTASSKVIINVLHQFEVLNQKSGHEVVINWSYDDDDEDMLEEIKNFEEMLSIKINTNPK